MSSISFDRAAEYYDSTRALPSDHATAVTDLLAAELTDKQPALEIGVGTGRIALPLHERGISMVGVDLSAPMLNRLVTNATATAPPFPLGVADVTQLPFADAVFGAVLASHVFHLITDWRTAADEALRVLRPGGTLLVDFGGGIDAPWRDVLLDTIKDFGIERMRPGCSDSAEMADYFGARAPMRQLTEIMVPVRRSIGQDVRDIERQIFSWTWPYTPEQMAAAATTLRERAVQEGFDLEAEASLDYELRVWAYDVP